MYTTEKTMYTTEFPGFLVMQMELIKFIALLFSPATYVKQSCDKSLTLDSCGIQREMKEIEQASTVGGVIAN